MPIELRVPEVGESITEVQIGAWLKAQGEPVRSDEPVVEIETDKVTVHLPSPVNGVVTQVLKKEGETATVGEIIGYMEEAGVVAGESPAKTTSGAADSPTLLPAEVQPRPVPRSQPRIMPAARRVLEQHGLEPDEVEPSGPGGRVLKEDVERALRRQPQVKASEHPRIQPAPADDRQEEIVPMTPLRRRIAQRLVEAHQTGALLTTFNEIDMTAVIGLRRSYQEAFQERYHVKIGFMSFFVKAVIDALQQWPQLNAEVRGTDIVYHNYYDIGIAVGSGKGLTVPILRNAERMSFAEIELAIADFTRRAQDGTLEISELYGGTFSITNGGVYGSLLSTPIVNPPQSGILGMHKIEDRPVAIAGQVVIRPMMYVALTYDHRIVDGRQAVSFLRRVKECIEDPARMLIEV